MRLFLFSFIVLAVIFCDKGGKTENKRINCHRRYITLITFVCLGEHSTFLNDMSYDIVQVLSTTVCDLPRRGTSRKNMHMIGTTKWTWRG